MPGCFTASNGNKIKLDWVDLKKHDISKTVAPGGIRVYLERDNIWRHNKFNHTTLENDLALVFLSEGVSTEGLDLAPAIADESDGVPIVPGDSVDVVGWGKTSTTGEYSNTPQSATLGYLSNEDCGEGMTSDKMCAASTTQEIKGPCGGDLV